MVYEETIPDRICRRRRAIRRTRARRDRAVVRPSPRRPWWRRRRRRFRAGPASATRRATGRCAESQRNFFSIAMLAGRKSAIASFRTRLRISRQHDRGLDRAAMNAVTQFFCGKQSIRRAEARPARGDHEKPMMRAQILRHQRHRGAVAAMARHHHELPDARARDAFADRHPFLQRDVGRQRLRARIIDMLGGNADRLQRQKGDGDARQATVRAPAPDRPRRSGRRFRAADAGHAARSPPAAAPRSSARRRPLAISGQWMSVQSRGGTVEVIERSVSLDEFAG